MNKTQTSRQNEVAHGISKNRACLTLIRPGGGEAVRKQDAGRAARTSQRHSLWPRVTCEFVDHENQPVLPQVTTVSLGAIILFTPRIHPAFSAVI